jgi:hypothetical protein
MNGVESEEKRMLREVAQSGAKAVTPAVSGEGKAENADDGVDEDDSDESDDGTPVPTDDASPAASTRSKSRQRKKG